MLELTFIHHSHYKNLRDLHLCLFSSVLVPPDIIDQMTSSDITVREGDNATLTCKAVGHPQPRIVWKREDGEKITLRNQSRDSISGKSIFESPNKNKKKKGDSI